MCFPAFALVVTIRVANVLVRNRRTAGVQAPPKLFAMVDYAERGKTVTSPWLASQWVSAITTPFASCIVKDLLGIPNEMEPYDMMALGYPALHPNPKLMRGTGKMVHYDDCGQKDFRSESEVRDFVRRARHWTIGTHTRKPVRPVE
jgi:hypothetical protein